jgi:hypothetical protein
MNLRRRLTVLAMLAASFLALYGLGRYYSPALVRYVVIQTLLEKAPAGTDPAWVRSRVTAIADASAEDMSATARMLAISQKIEKIQKLTAEQMRELLGADSGGSAGPTVR